MPKTEMFACSECRTAAKGRKAKSEGFQPPNGWKRRRDDCLLCKDCVKRLYVLRAVALPVVGVVAANRDPSTPLAKLKKATRGRKATKEEKLAIKKLQNEPDPKPCELAQSFVVSMLDAFRASTDLFNWAIRELLAVDVKRLPSCVKMPSMSPINLGAIYKDQGCPLGDIAAQQRGVIFEQAQKHYLRERLPALWHGNKALPMKRFPAPFPVHNQSWSAIFADVTMQGKVEEKSTLTVPTISVKLHGEESGPRWVLRLGQGKHFARQMAAFRQIVNGDTINGQLDFYAQPCGDVARQGIVIPFRENSGGQRSVCRLMVKMVARFPRVAKPKSTEELFLTTNAVSFWTAELAGREVRPWLLNGDHLKRWQAEMQRWQRKHADHLAFLQRTGEDFKHEKRWPLRKRRQFQGLYQKRCEKHRRRIKTWIQQAVAQVVNYAKRRGVALIDYTDCDRGFFPSFEWAALRTQLQQQCDANGIACVVHG